MILTCFFLPCSASSVLREAVTQETLWPSALCCFYTFFFPLLLSLAQTQRGSSPLLSSAGHSMELTFGGLLKEVWNNLFVRFYLSLSAYVRRLLGLFWSRRRSHGGLARAQRTYQRCLKENHFTHSKTTALCFFVFCFCLWSVTRHIRYHSQ